MENQTMFDPVSQRAVAVSGSPISFLYHGRTYYFEKLQNRDAFESNPDKYLAGSPTAGKAGRPEPGTAEKGRRDGCC
jgi:YHS domain-containing protein